MRRPSLGSVPSFARPVRRLGVATVLVAALLASAAAQAVNRCEGRDGRVTYTDEPCPANARSARRVDDSPPVVVRDPRAAAIDTRDAAKEAARESATDASKEVPRTGTAEPAKAPVREAGKDAVREPTNRLQPGRIVASSNPEQEMQRLDELRARQARQCADLRRRIDYARGDLQSAGGNDRASAELALRRLQEEAKLVCPAR